MLVPKVKELKTVSQICSETVFDIYNIIFKSSSLSSPADINSEHRWRFVLMVFSFSFPRQASHEPPLSVPRFVGNGSSWMAKLLQKCIIWRGRPPLSGHLNTKMNHVTLFLPPFSPPLLLFGALSCWEMSSDPATVSPGEDLNCLSICNSLQFI